MISDTAMLERDEKAELARLIVKYGDPGVAALEEATTKLKELRAELATVKAERDRWLARMQLLERRETAIRAALEVRE